MTDKENKSTSASVGRIATLVISVLILAAAAGVIYLIVSSEPTAQRTAAVKETAMLVEVETAQRGTYQPLIIGLGTVRPAQDIVISPRVSGRVIDIAADFMPGGLVRRGQVLLRIDQSDYENSVEKQRSLLRQAEADLAIEMGRQDVARKEFAMLEQNLSEENKALVLREPQLETAKARVDSARTELQQAELNLQRTTIRAPFDGQVIDRNISAGSQVAPGDDLGRFIGTDTYWIIATVPLSKVNQISFSENGTGSNANVRDRAAWEEDEYRKGTVNQLIGSLDDTTRLARILITVPDPLARKDENHGRRLMVGSIVEVSILGIPLENVIRVNRNYIRKNDTIWIMKEGMLSIQQIQIGFMDREYAYVSSGIEDGSKIVKTNLATVAEGSPLRTQSNPEAKDNPAETSDKSGESAE